MLAWFLLVSAGIAFCEWSLSPQIVPLWAPHELGFDISFGVYFSILSGLAAAWAIVVGIGFFKCGWPAFLMLIFAKWGLFPLYFWIAVLWACAHGNCI